MASTTTTQKKKTWLPLESNPQMMNKYLQQIGVNVESSGFEFCDVFGFDEELLSMVPQPVIALMMLFPITPENEKKKIEEDAQGSEASEDLFFMKQTIGNACGTIGLIHAVLNNTNKLEVVKSSFISDFLTKAKTVSPAERAKLLEEDNRVEEVHEKVASSEENTTNAQNSMDTDLHFVCFVEKNGFLYELDGRRSGPVNRGKTSEQTFLRDAIGIVQQYMNLNPGNIQFSVAALAPAAEF